MKNQESQNRRNDHVANRIDYAEIIKARITVPDAVGMYTGQRIERNRICCPVHHGSDRNMRIYRNSYHCFVCHATGDVIQFVRDVTGDSFQDAMKRLNRDFALNLPLDGKPNHDLDKKALDELKRGIAERNVENLLKDTDTLINGMHNANLAGLIHVVEQICRSYAPRSSESEWSETWCNAMKLRTLLYAEIR